MRREAIMERERVTLVLDHDARPSRRCAASSALSSRIERMSLARAPSRRRGAFRRRGPRSPEACSGAKNRSSSASGRPLTNASAPPISWKAARARRSGPAAPRLPAASARYRGSCRRRRAERRWNGRVDGVDEQFALLGFELLDANTMCAATPQGKPHGTTNGPSLQSPDRRLVPL